MTRAANSETLHEAYHEMRYLMYQTEAHGDV